MLPQAMFMARAVRDPMLSPRPLRQERPPSPQIHLWRPRRRAATVTVPRAARATTRPESA
jgi:hypothetical protein